MSAALERNKRAAQAFYACLFGWEVIGDEEYGVARLRGLDVAGIGTQIATGLPETWTTPLLSLKNETGLNASLGAAGAGRVRFPSAQSPSPPLENDRPAPGGA